MAFDLWLWREQNEIIILGAGQVGTTLAANLVSEDNDITLVDNESQHLQNLQDKHDLRVVKGSPSSPKVLRDAGAADADLMVAVTASDEINMIACQLGYTLFNTPTRIARIRNAEYLREKDKLFNDENVPIDHLISPENLVTDEITRLIAYPGALQVAHFANNRISIVIVKSVLRRSISRLCVIRVLKSICHILIAVLFQFYVMIN